MAANQAPTELALVQSFVNTADIEEGKDELATPERLGDWLRAARLGGDQPDAEEHRRCLALRDAIRGLALANNGGPVYALDLAVLNRLAFEAALRPRFGPSGQARLEPDSTGVNAALGRLIAAVFEAMTTGRWARMKACRRHGCRWLFYDSSKNRSGAWCSMAVCGNRTKVEQYRARRAGR